MIDCSKPQGNHGCSGGWPSYALDYVVLYGITGVNYPYIAADQDCKVQGGSYKIKGYNLYEGCDGLGSEIFNYPISVNVDASNWSSYKSGVFNICG